MRNVLKEYGYSNEAVAKKIEAAWKHIFEDEATKFYFDDNGKGFMMDTGNIDARSEGMSYGMMMAVQMNRKDVFDKLWLWAMTYMYQKEGPFKGYFAWSCAPDGTKNSEGPAPDGEEYFALALMFASGLWGDGKPPFDYSHQAKEIIRAMIYQEKPMFHAENKYILFVPDSPFSDPSYHLPHFYELIAEGCYPEDRKFMLDAAKASREYLPTSCHPVTGLAPDYAHFDGSPVVLERRPIAQAHYSDSYRVALNIGMDSLWSKNAKPWNAENAEKIQKFFLSRPDAMTETVVYIDGSPYPEEVMHPLGLLATAAAVSAARPVNPESKQLIDKFMSADMLTCERRYYDNCLYFFSLLALAGEYKIM